MTLDPQAIIIRLLALLPALTLHEFAHAYTATRAGDPTPSAAGRVTLNPLSHLDPIGTLAIIFLPIGWAKPVPVNPANFRNPGRDDIIVSASGAVSNIAQAIFWALSIRLLGILAPGVIISQGNYTLVAGFLSFMILINVALAIFNLLPVGPLDGHHILANLLPFPQSQNYLLFNRQYGMLMLIGILFLGSMTRLLGYIIVLPAVLTGYFLAGIDISSAMVGSGIW